MSDPLSSRETGVRAEKPWQHRFGLALLLLISTTILGILSFHLGFRSVETPGQQTAFRISGDSMAPTFAGDTTVVYCERCELVSTTSTKNLSRNPITCKVCGTLLHSPEETALAPSTVRIRIPDPPPQRGDIVAVHWNEHDHLKRVVAIPGDTIQRDGLTLLVNGKRIAEAINESPIAFPLPRKTSGEQFEYRLRPQDDQTQYPLTLLPDHYFVLGDNVRVSVDSRDVGAIDVQQLIGIAQRTNSQPPNSQPPNSQQVETPASQAR